MFDRDVNSSPQTCRTSRGEIPTVCNEAESLFLSALAAWVHLESWKRTNNPTAAMQVFTARSKNIQRDPEQVVLNKPALSCSVCWVDGTKIRWAGQHRPGFLRFCVTVKVNPPPKELDGGWNNEWLELDFAQRAPAWLTHSTIKSKCWQLGLISHNCCGLGTEKPNEWESKIQRKREKQRQSLKRGVKNGTSSSLDVTWGYYFRARVLFVFHYADYCRFWRGRVTEK